MRPHRGLATPFEIGSIAFTSFVPSRASTLDVRERWTALPLLGEVFDVRVHLS